MFLLSDKLETINQNENCNSKITISSKIKTVVIDGVIVELENKEKLT